MFGPLYGTLGPLGRAFARAVEAASTLLNGLVSYWPLNEQSGTRYDVVGTNHLTDNNTVGAVLRGPEGTVARFVAANTESLSSTSAQLLTLGSGGAGASIAVWHRRQSAPAAYPLFIGIDNQAGGTVPFLCWTGADNNAYVTVQPTGEAALQASVLFAGSDRDWHLWAATWDATDRKGRLYKDGVLVATTAAGTAATTITAGAFFGVGGWPRYANEDGEYGCGAAWEQTLSQSDLADLFASGNGLRYADLPAGLMTGLVSWWELDEVSGVRYDSHGANDLTDNNTVGSVNSGPKGVVASFVASNSESLSKAGANLDFSSTGYAVSMWARLSTDGALSGVFSLGTAWNLNMAMLAYKDSNLIRFLAADGSASVQVAPAILDTNYHHYFMTFDAADKKVRVWQDGVVVGTPSAALAGTLAAGTNVIIGKLIDQAYHVDAGLASIGVWADGSLGAAEALSLFALGRGLKYDALPAGLLTGLVSYWNLDEASGVRYDSHGSNDLTDNNTVGSVINAGDAMDGAAASFVKANSEYIDCTIDALPEWSVSGWCKPSGADGVLIDFSDLWPNNTAGAFYIGGTLWYILIGNGSTYYYTFITPTAADTVYGQWTHFVFWYDPAEKVAKISFNNGSPFSTTVLSGDLYQGTGTLPFRIGNGPGAGIFDGVMDEVAIWDRVLTADERTELFRAGAGKYYPFPLA